MMFALDGEQTAFGRTLDRMLGGADAPGAARAWAAGDPGPGRALWRRLADAGVFALAVPETYGSVGPLPVELAVAYVELGRHAVPGPVVETAATAVLLGALAERDGTLVEGGGALAERGGTDPAAPAAPVDPVDPVDSAGRWLPRIASGQAMVTLGAPQAGPYVLDADAADAVFVVSGNALRQATGHGPVQPSQDPARRLFRPVCAGPAQATGPRPDPAVAAAGRADAPGQVGRPGQATGPSAGPARADGLRLDGPAVAAAAARAADWAAFATAAQALGVGLALLERTVAYTRQRSQFGRAIGSFQAVKHRLADVLVELEFARPLLYGAAVALAGGAPGAGAEVAAAKVAAGEAAYGAARAALQLHGAIGYTSEYDLSLWLRKARALRSAWGDPAGCRARVLAAHAARHPVKPEVGGVWHTIGDEAAR
ncbi:acyl-CoA dehydrogenase [Streptomyces sp. XD-27]|uniref:acyl-CoA dehydrogenase n=1 Tax=Streptomyces sp. XD-27 TaxID=3062779 RepID=UPI0026F41AE3|nr:acyl-CoA dehydrogenase [Streptomyces sp. XD-27]WKX68770.1 acyl-CoA dehydrogenase [Streptomyces sp. XD-27]